MAAICIGDGSYRLKYHDWYGGENWARKERYPDQDGTVYSCVSYQKCVNALFKEVEKFLEEHSNDNPCVVDMDCEIDGIYRDSEYEHSVLIKYYDMGASNRYRLFYMDDSFYDE